MISAKRLDLLQSINQDNFLLSLITLKRLQGNTLWQENNEAHNYNVQMQVRRLEQEADARFSQRLRDLLSRFSQEANQALENQREILVTEVTSEVWRRDEQVYDLRTELSLQALHQEDVT